MEKVCDVCSVVVVVVGGGDVCVVEWNWFDQFLLYSITQT